MNVRAKLRYMTLPAVALGVALMGLQGRDRAAQAAPGAVPVAVALPAQGQQFGTIKGRLVWGGSDVPQPRVLVKKGDPSAKDPSVCAATNLTSKELVVDPSTKGIQYGFAYVNRPKGTNPAAVQDLVKTTGEIVIDQKNCEFIPFSSAFHQDQKVLFKSSDPVNHNVRLAGFVNAGFNQLLPPNGKTETALKAERRPMKLSCDIHPWMEGYVMVFDHPFFAVTGPDGSFEIRGVPAGTQNLVVWQDKVGYVTPRAATGLPVQVKAGQTTDVGEIKLDPAKVR